MQGIKQKETLFDKDPRGGTGRSILLLEFLKEFHNYCESLPSAKRSRTTLEKENYREEIIVFSWSILLELETYHYNYTNLI